MNKVWNDRNLQIDPPFSSRSTSPVEWYLFLWSFFIIPLYYPFQIHSRSIDWEPVIDLGTHYSIIKQQRHARRSHRSPSPAPLIDEELQRLRSLWNLCPFVSHPPHSSKITCLLTTADFNHFSDVTASLNLQTSFTSLAFSSPGKYPGVEGPGCISLTKQ